jgi:hypothetical protein
MLTLVIVSAALIEVFGKKKGYKVFFDDLRTVDMVYDSSMESEFIVVRNVKDFKKLIQEKGIPDFVSFDHDLGEDEFGNIAEDVYDAVKWMVYVKEYDLRKMDFVVHSDNPVGAKNIESLINNWNRELDRRDGKL